MQGKYRLLVVVFIVMGCMLTACGDNSSSSTKVIATDYSQNEHWLALPAIEKDIDVFYLYPTAWQKIDPTDPNINEIDNASMLLGSNYAFDIQATAFETVGDVYAPYYRQADIQYVLTLPTLEEREQVIAGAPTLDAMAAFDYYIQHFNNGRPFILAGHSQGSNVLLNILADYMEANPEVYERMIAAYVIGYSVTQTYLDNNPHLKFAQTADDTGVIISYNTQSPDVEKGDNPVVTDGGLVINPLTWTRDETPALISEGLGSFMSVEGVFTQVAQYADATIDLNQGVVTTTVDPIGLSQGLGAGVYHRYDYSFYYFNLRENAANRIETFFILRQH